MYDVRYISISFKLVDELTFLINVGSILQVFYKDKIYFVKHFSEEVFTHEL